MARNDEGEFGDFELDHFERNRYFQGKLMNARDMQAEQEYHSERLETVTRLTSGKGIVAGLDISDFEFEDGQLQVTIDPGLAIDESGRPIVVRTPTHETFEPTGDELYVYVEYDSELKDPVPLPGEQPVSDRASEESRVLETYQIFASSTGPNADKSPTGFRAAERSDDAATLAETASAVADGYHRAHRSDVAGSGDQSLLLGAFQQEPDGDWIRGEHTERRPYVYDNDMLFDLLISHVTNEQNPHGTTGGAPGDEDIDFPEENVNMLRQRVGDLDDVVDTLSDDIESQHRHARYTSLKAIYRQFDSLATRFEDDSDITRTALQIAQRTEQALQEDQVDVDESAYLSFVDDILPQIETLAEHLDGEVTDRDYQSFSRQADELTELVSDSGTAHLTVRAVERLGESAEFLEPLVTGR